MRRYGRWVLAMMAGLVLLSVHAAHPLEDRLWDAQAKRFISQQAFLQRAEQARYVLLGERHDSEAHHARQLLVLQMLGELGVRPALALEQFDHEHQDALRAAQAAGQRDAEALADAGRLNRRGWRWPMYRDLIDHAAVRGWPLLAANLSRAEARRIVLGETRPELAPIDPMQQGLLEADVILGHCGHRPPAAVLAGMVAAQRARDARMAATLDAASDGPVVLIAGAGHVRRDRAVPRYLADPARALTVGLIEVIDGSDDPGGYDAAGFDVLWFTPSQRRPDPCAAPLPGLAGPGSSSSISRNSVSKDSP